MNMHVVGIFMTLILHAFLNEAWASQRYGYDHQWTVEEAQIDLVFRFRYAPDHVKIQEAYRFYTQIPREDAYSHVLGMRKALIGMDVEPHRLQLAHARHIRSRDDLIVLLVFPEHGVGEALVLDGNHPRIRPLSDRRDILVMNTISEKDVPRIANRK